VNSCGSSFALSLICREVTQSPEFVSSDQSMRTIIFRKKVISLYVFTFLSCLQFSDDYSAFQALNTSLETCMS